MASAFNGAGQFALEASADASDAGGQNFTAGGEEAFEKLNIFVVDRQRSIGLEGACFTFGATESTTVIGTIALGCYSI